MSESYDDVTREELEAARAYLMEIVWSPIDEAFLVSFPDLPGVRSHGRTLAEAAEWGEEAIVGWYTAVNDAGQPLPPPVVRPRVAASAS